MIVDLIEGQNGDVILPIPESICKEMNIGQGSELSFEPQENGSIIMKRKNELKVFAVEVLSSFRLVYFVKAESAEHAMDEVTCDGNELNYFQQSLDTTVINGYEADDATVYRLIRETEQPDLTREEFNEGKWLENTLNVIDYTK